MGRPDLVIEFKSLSEIVRPVLELQQHRDELRERAYQGELLRRQALLKFWEIVLDRRDELIEWLVTFGGGFKELAG